MAIGALCRFAAGAPVAVFTAVGHDALERVENLSLDATIDLVASPRHAVLLLVAGKIRNDDRPALRILHDQLPGLRATLWWGADPFDGLAAPVALALSDDPVPMLHDLNRRLYAGTLQSEPDLLSDEPPTPWRGVGDHGQGGKGMMGGKPYGRPMAMTGDDRRDGLSLDEYTVQVGPFMPTLPPGLVLELVLQGDVIQKARVIRPPLPSTPEARGGTAARLRSAARLLTMLQLGAYAERCRRAAEALEHGAEPDLASLRQSVRRTGARAAIPLGLGRCRLDGVESDVRSRFDEWLGAGKHALHVDPADSTASIEPPWPELLNGLEWNEAMLVVNSLTTAQLRLVEPAAKDPEAHPSAEHEH